jgi:rod shape determining protein RodA
MQHSSHSSHSVDRSAPPMLKPLPIEREPRLDWLQIGALLGLMVIGWFFVYSASMVGGGISSLPWWRQQPSMQAIWCLVGIVAAFVVCLVDYRKLSRYAVVIYWASMISLVLVLFIGDDRGWGARRWINVGPLGFQPSEFAKIAVILALADYLSRPQDELRRWKVFCKTLGLVALPFALILKEPDLGSALLLAPVGLAMMYVAGVPLPWLKRLVGGTVLLLALLVANVLFAPEKVHLGGYEIQTRLPIHNYQRNRLLVYFNLDYVSADAPKAVRERAERQKRNDSYNVEQALISVGSGGLTGKGWRQGTQNALGFLPRGVAHNDFIFSVIAEERGFLGSATVVVLYTVVLFTGIRIASQARDRLGRLLAVGVVALLFSQAFINIGMNIRLVPVTGVPLPLLSYGGSSVLAALIAMGILQNVYLHRRSY